ncbi:AAA family ATPase [Bacillus sp. 6YEL31]|nr:AAA family ATPase [Bacillus sp. 6YEL31]
MSVIEISQIYINNFKLFKNLPQPIKLLGKNLTILDGPNGFGKTSIFDVIELVLTGELKRIGKSDARNKYKEILFQNDKTKDSIIRIEFIQRETGICFTIAKKIQANCTTERNSPDDFSIFETYLLDSFDGELDNKKIIKDYKDIERKFGIAISNIFNLVYYIEQEDNKFFLRMNEGERLKQISSLFNTDKENKEVDMLKESRSKVKQLKDEYYSKLQIINSNLKELNQILKDDIKEIKYACLLPHMRNLEKWDEKNLKVNKISIKEIYLQELNQLKDFVVKFKDYTTKKFSLEIDKFVGDEELLKSYIVLKDKGDYVSEIIEKYEKQLEIYAILKGITKADFFVEWKETEFGAIFEYLKEMEDDIFPRSDYLRIENEIKELKFHEQNSNQISESISQLINIREKFIGNFKKHISEHDFSGENCPLCGSNWGTQGELIGALEEQKKVLETMLDDTSKFIKEGLENLFDDLIEPFVKRALTFFKEDNQKIISSKFYFQIKESVLKEEQVEEFIKWLKENSIEFHSLIQNEKYIEFDILSKNIISIQKELGGYHGYVNSDIGEEEIKLFDAMFERLFDSDSNLVNQLQLNKIDQKIKYINWCYYNNNFAEKKKLDEQKEEINTKYKKIDKMYKDIGKIISEYNEKIKIYWKKIMKDIEIVFYVYSAKILQYHQRGLGIFFKESESKSIRFITDPDRDHDVSNFMSSGQLAAIILALTLSLNKVYGNQGVAVLLIDDPLQTMDDINSASFVELLRNDFSDKQIVLSTHEDDISNYMLYKFSNYKLNAQSISLKNSMFLN